jgi:hypothetical protein
MECEQPSANREPECALDSCRLCGAPCFAGAAISYNLAKYFLLLFCNMATIPEGPMRRRFAWSVLKTMLYFILKKDIPFIMHSFFLLKLDSLHYEPERRNKTQNNVNIF